MFSFALIFANGWFTACDGFHGASACWLSDMKQLIITTTAANYVMLLENEMSSGLKVRILSDREHCSLSRETNNSNNISLFQIRGPYKPDHRHKIRKNGQPQSNLIYAWPWRGANHFIITTTVLSFTRAQKMVSHQRWPESLFSDSDSAPVQNFWIRVRKLFKFENSTPVPIPAAIIDPSIFLANGPHQIRKEIFEASRP